MLAEEPHNLRNFREILREYCRVENYAQLQSPRTLYVEFTQGVERSFRIISPTLLGHVHMKGHIGQTIFREFRQQAAGGPDAIGEQGRAHPHFADFAHNGDQLVACPQRGISPSYLHVRVRAVMAVNHFDAPEYFSEGNIPHGFGTRRQITKCAIQVATLRDLQGHAPHRPAPARELAILPQTCRIEALDQRPRTSTAFRKVTACIPSVDFLRGQNCIGLAGHKAKQSG